ncbi:hypothetical protein OHB24_20550 [Kribbella sp. NBC_00482]|uniref:RHS repeat-associated core domain-containing protein n=1 Tax=Kribbella sp. NBC_00482 TaxID=2975968 RepID=UPI002E1852BE
MVLMGARVYNPSTGLFTSVDPVRRGNANQYTYPTDAINRSDLNGKKERAEGGGGTGDGKLTRAQKRRLIRYAKRVMKNARKLLKRVRALRARVRRGDPVPGNQVRKYGRCIASILMFGLGLAGVAAGIMGLETPAAPFAAVELVFAIIDLLVAIWSYYDSCVWPN